MDEEDYDPVILTAAMIMYNEATGVPLDLNNSEYRGRWYGLAEKWLRALQQAIEEAENG